MEVSQVVSLADWFQKNMRAVEPKYVALVSVLQNNSQQPSQLPVTAPLRELSNTLAEMATSEISTLQLRVLDDLEVAKFIGKRGKSWINKLVRATTYDPATTYQTVQQAYQKLEEARRLLNEFKTAAGQVGFTNAEIVDAPTPYIFNVIFQKEASINNTQDFKKAAKDWELIIGGVTAIAGEKPEDVTIVGAQNGSIILTLSATPFVTKIMAMISKHIASIANDYLDFEMKRQELRRSKMMSDTIERDLLKQEQERRASGKNLIVEAVKALVPSAQPEELSKLENAIDRHIAFSEKGGDIDFVLPPELTEKDLNYDEKLAQTIVDMRAIIQEYRSETQKTKLLTHVKEDSENFEEEE